MGEAVDTIECYSKYTQQVSFREPGQTDKQTDGWTLERNFLN